MGGSVCNVLSVQTMMYSHIPSKSFQVCDMQVVTMIIYTVLCPVCVYVCARNSSDVNAYRTLSVVNLTWKENLSHCIYSLDCKGPQKQTNKSFYCRYGTHVIPMFYGVSGQKKYWGS